MLRAHPQTVLQVQVWVAGDALNNGTDVLYYGTNYSMAFKPPVNISRCVPEPRFDLAAQQMVWNLSW